MRTSLPYAYVFMPLPARQAHHLWLFPRMWRVTPWWWWMIEIPPIPSHLITSHHDIQTEEVSPLTSLKITLHPSTTCLAKGVAWSILLGSGQILIEIWIRREVERRFIPAKPIDRENSTTLAAPSGQLEVRVLTRGGPRTSTSSYVLDFVTNSIMILLRRGR